MLVWGTLLAQSSESKGNSPQALVSMAPVFSFLHGLSGKYSCYH